MSDIVNHEGDLKKYAPGADPAKIEKIRKYLGIALQSRDASLVAASDPTEMARIRDGYAKKKLGLTDDTAIEAALKAVADKMKGDRSKSRICFYYLLAEHKNLT